MRRADLAIAAVVASALGSAPMISNATEKTAPAVGRLWRALGRDELCVTSGGEGTAARPERRFAVDAPTFRAVSSLRSEARAQLAFTYLGPTEATRALGSGAVRRQLGLKLRAENACNLVYVMWRLEPKNELVVSVKRNPGQRTSKECGNRGYRNVAARAVGPLPSVAPGAGHALRAELEGEELRVTVDGALVWQGALPREALGFEGPVGVRSDNVRFEGELSAAGVGSPVSCSAAEGAD